MLAIMKKLQGKIVEIFFISVILLTFWEYVVGVFLEKVFKTKYWDYSDHKINFQGRICLTNSIAWGFIGVIFINYVHPYICSIIEIIPSNVFSSIIYGSLSIMIVDVIISIIKINSIKDKLVKIKELNVEIKQRLSEIKENTINDKNKVTENVQLHLNQLKIKRNRMMRRLYRYVYRLKKAFPAINTKETMEILNKKFLSEIKIAKEKRRK